MLRVEQRAQHRKVLEAAATSRQEVNKALEDLLALDPTIFEGPDSSQVVAEEDINNFLAETVEETVIKTFEEENGTDDNGAMGNALRSLEKLDWDDSDVKFFFNRCETRMQAAGIKKNYKKFQILIQHIPTLSKSVTTKGAPSIFIIRSGHKSYKINKTNCSLFERLSSFVKKHSIYANYLNQSPRKELRPF